MKTSYITVETWRDQHLHVCYTIVRQMITFEHEFSFDDSFITCASWEFEGGKERGQGVEFSFDLLYKNL